MKAIRFLFKLAAGLLIMGVSLSVNATENIYKEIDGICYCIVAQTDYTAATVVSYSEAFNDTTKYSGQVVIPQSVFVDGKDIPVKTIASNAFYSCPDLRSVFIPESIITICNYSFFDVALDSLSLPSDCYKTEGMCHDCHIGRLVFRTPPPELDYCTALSRWFLRGGNNVIDTVDIHPVNMVAIDLCMGEIDMIHFHHLNEVKPAEYVFQPSKDPDSPRYMILDDEVPPTALGEYAGTASIGGSLLFVPDNAVEEYKAATFWNTAKAIYPQSRLPEVDQLLSSGIVQTVGTDRTELSWAIEGNELTLKPTEGRTYIITDLQGRQIKRTSSYSSLTLTAGAYIIRCGSQAEKIIIR